MHRASPDNIVRTLALVIVKPGIADAEWSAMSRAKAAAILRVVAIALISLEAGAAAPQPLHGSLLTPRWREVDSNHRFLVGRSNRDGRRPGCLETGADLLGNRRFESTSLHRRVGLSPR